MFAPGWPGVSTANNSQLGLGYGQIVYQVASSRALSTTYYNTTNKPIFVAVVVTSSINFNCNFVVNGITFASTFGNSSQNALLVGIVPVGGSYSANVTAGTPSITSWQELR